MVPEALEFARRLYVAVPTHAGTCHSLPNTLYALSTGELGQLYSPLAVRKAQKITVSTPALKKSATGGAIFGIIRLFLWQSH
jgi:hypothetical protein